MYCAPAWFTININWKLKFAAKNFYFIVKSTRYLDDSNKANVDPVLRRNAFAAHAENILLAMVCDEGDFTRKIGYRRILAARNFCHRFGVRRFKVPDINLNANHFTGLIDGNRFGRIEPPLNKHLTNEELQAKSQAMFLQS